MLEVFRLCRALGQRPIAESTLELSVVRRIESELGVTLHDDVLALLAARSPVLTTATGISSDRILDFAEDWSGAFPDGFVAVALVAEEPFVARDTRGELGGALRAVAVERAPNPDEPARILLAERKRARPSDDAAEETSTLAAFAHANISTWFRHRDGWFEALAREKDLVLDDPTFRPAIVGSVEAAPPRSERFVTHAKFGRGKVVETRVEGGETKLVIDFDSVGQKVLLERFVQASPS
jgi:hypothetical protein